MIVDLLLLKLYHNVMYGQTESQLYLFPSLEELMHGNFRNMHIIYCSHF